MSRCMFLSACVALLGLTAISQVPKNSPAPPMKPYIGQAAQRAKDRGWTVVEGDIIQDKVTPRSEAVKPRPRTLTVASPSSLWPQVSGVATVYYVNANAGATDAADEAANANIQTAINTFNADFSGLIQWVPWTSSDGSYYVEINLNQYDFSGECEAAEGYEAEAGQPMDGSAACTVGTILHEMGHVIGLWHEFERPDRNSYVTVNYNNVIKGSWGNFQTLTQNAQILGPYDYASLMQYPPYSFSRNGGPVIETIPAGMPLGGVEGVPVPASTDYSAGDKETIERLYGVPPTQVTITSNPVGLKVEVDGATITTPHTYNWALNSTHTLAVASGLQTLTGDIEDSTTSATFTYIYGRWNDNGTQSHTITVLPGDGATGFPSTAPQVATYSANFIQLVPYTSSVYPASTGTVAVSPTPTNYYGSPYFIARQLATLTATPASGWSFYEFNNGPFWLPGGLGANPKTFYVPDTGNPVDPSAEFTNAPVYKVDITPETFSSNLSVYVDGEFVYTPKNFSPYEYYDTTWTPGSTHTLTYYTPEYPYSVNSRYALSYWSDLGAASHTTAPLPSTSTSYIATVTPEFAPATNFSYPPCGGTGTLSPASPTGDGFYPSGQVLTYNESPGSNWVFGGWTYDITGLQNPAMLTATDETLVFANFNIVDAPLTLASVSPSSANVGGSQFTLTFNGTGFSQYSVVGVTIGTNTIYPTVNYISPTELTVQIPASAIASPGTFQVYVENFPPGSNGCAVFGYQTFVVHGATLATSTAVTSSSNPSAYGTAVTFTAAVAASESNATGAVTFMNGSSVLGTVTLSGPGVATYTTSALAAGAQTITAVYGGDSNNLASTSAALTQTVAQTGATLTTPAAGSTFAGPSATFTWAAASGATNYQIWIGSTGAGSNNVGQPAPTTTTSLTFGALPTNGETLYVRLTTNISGSSVHADYVFTAATQAVLTSPAPGGILTGTSATFKWTAAPGATQYDLYLGTTGIGSNNLWGSGGITATSVAFAGLPASGQTIYARLLTNFNGNWVHADYTYTAASAAVLALPVPGATFTGPTATFSWTPGTGATLYSLWLGTNGVGTDNLFGSSEMTATSVTFRVLPTNGQTVYARLFTDFAGTWVHNDYVYTAASQAVLTGPAPGGTLPGPSTTFSWTPGTSATQYDLYLGTTGVGSNNLWGSGGITATSVAFAGLPTNGETIYARMLTDYNGYWVHSDYTYTAAAAAVMQSPAPGSTLPGATATFTWSPGTGATQYSLWVGTTGVGSDNILGAPNSTATSVTVNRLPTNGATVYVRLFTNFNGAWVHADYTYTAE
jgi:hypothetical protein